jgi:hypothetical protein
VEPKVTAQPYRSLALVVAVLSAACGGGTSPPTTRNAEDGGRPAETAWSVSVQPLEVPAAAEGSGQPQLTTSARGVILSWLEQRDATTTLKFAERTGGTWSGVRTVASDDNWFVSWADVPTVLRMSDGTLVATWNPAIDPALEAYELRLAYSRDDGATWSRPIAPHHDGTRTQHGFPSLFELPDATLGLVWLDGRDQELKASDPDAAAMSLYFARFDRGWKQIAESAIDTRVCECCPTAAAVTDDGVVTAFRDRTPREIRDINVVRLENGVWTPARPLHVDGWEIEACPVNGPALSARGRNVAAAWFTAAGENGRVLGAFSTDAGRTWGEPVALSDGVPRGHVDIELLDDGSAAATWVELGDEGSQVRMRRIEASGGRSVSIDVSGSGRVTGYPRMARFGTELIFVWPESLDGGRERLRAATARVP